MTHTTDELKAQIIDRVWTPTSDPVAAVLRENLAQVVMDIVHETGDETSWIEACVHELVSLCHGVRPSDPTPTGRKVVSPRELVESGTLQELNRRFLHPLGMALSCTVDTDGNVALGDVLDNRDDPEGYVFADLDADAAKKAAGIDASLTVKAGHRRERLGFVVQPIPGYDEPSDDNAE